MFLLEFQYFDVGRLSSYNASLSSLFNGSFAPYSTREASDRIRVGSLEHKYLFDLDTRDGERGLKFYTVDATHYGKFGFALEDNR